MIFDISSWALEAACALTISVNVSVNQFYQAGFVDEVHEIVTRYAIDPAKLKLELTENMILEGTEEAIAKMHLLKLLGICLSMDDFGTGYSSLIYL